MTETIVSDTRPCAPPAEQADEPELTVRKAGLLDRRQFLATTGGLLLAFTLKGNVRAAYAAGPPIHIDPDYTGDPVSANINAWIRIGADESVTVLIGSAEMGQGAYSGLAQIAAEELKVDWQKVTALPCPSSMAWITGGSTSIRNNYQMFRMAGATAREMLIAAAARTWKVPASACHAVNGAVVNSRTNASLTYGRLARLAAMMPVPANPPLTASADFQLIGKPVPRIDLPSKTDGSAVYGIDVCLPGMVFAVIKNCPTLGGTLQSTPSVPPGASAVVPLDNAVAVVATNTWQAMQAADQLEVSWNIPSSAQNLTSSVILAQAQQLMATGTPVTAERQGDATSALNGAARVLNMTYTFPYLAHACMEVLNCTVQLTATTCDIWAPTQAPGWVQASVAALTGLAAGNINVHPTLLGGGLGRKIEQDYVVQAIRVAKAIGQPVKLTWSREEDMGHDQYRPMALVNVKAGLDSASNVVGWSNRIVSPSILFQRGWIPGGALDTQATEGATELPYALGGRLVEFVRHTATVPVGFWRSVGHSFNAFAVESAIDEIALATGADPLTLRRRLLAASLDPLAPRSLAVLNAAAALGGWGSALAPGHAQGLAFASSFGSLVAQVVEISQPAAGSLTVHKVACVIDCGSAINPDSIAAQMQGGIFHGLSAILWGQVNFTNGRASAHNFSNYRMLRMKEAPTVSVQIIQSGAPLGGVGEPGVPPIGPAVANAYARLTGQRIRTLPFFPGATMGGG